MKKKQKRHRVCAVLMAAAMVITMMPMLGAAGGSAYAASSASGGTVVSNSAENALSAFGSSNAGASYSSKTLTITLKNDIMLNSPVRFVQGNADDKVILIMNGHSITAARGKSGTDQDAATGKDAIQIIPGMYDIEIKGPGSVTGGSGAVYETDAHNKYGTDGGMAVCFTAYEDASYWYPEGGVYDQKKLNYGLKVTGGAVLTGGEGGDVSASDLMYNIENYTGGRQIDAPNMSAGRGGAGIGQHVDRITSGDPVVAFSRIEIEDGVVNGGTGGSIDLSSITPTQYAIMTSSASASAMSGVSNKDNGYGYNVGSMMGMKAGYGGDGVLIGAGRKYLYVGESSSVFGGTNGTPEFGGNKAINRLVIGACISDAGNGISVNAGDIGLTDNNVEWDSNSYKTKTRDSDDMGIYIAGTVRGGDSADADAMYENAGSAGAGLFMNGDTLYDYVTSAKADNAWGHELGLVEIASGGSVIGGNGGSSVCGDAGLGGDGIREQYDRDTDGRTYGEYGTDYYIVNGTAAGGNGGDSMHLFAGTGGNGIDFLYNYRDYVNVSGSGSAIAGDSGTEAVRDGETASPDNTPEAVRFYQKYDTNNVTISKTDGKKITSERKSKINVIASMTAFSKNPTTSTKLSCTINKPSGYTGKVYINWFAGIYESSTSPYTEYDIETAGTDFTSFNLLSNSQYKYLAWPMYKNSTLNMNSYAVDVATIDRMAEDGKFKTDIYCVVMLEDGRWGKSNVMTFEKGKGWTGDSSQGGDSSADQQAADSVSAILVFLPDADNITLSDKGQVEEARAAYNALTSTQMSLVDSDAVDRLLAAESQIDKLENEAADQQAVKAVKEKILALPDAANVTDADNTAIYSAETAYEALTDDQKSYVPEACVNKLQMNIAAIEAIAGCTDEEKAEKISNLLADMEGMEEGSLDYQKALAAAQAAYNTIEDKTLVADADKVALGELTEAEDTFKANEVSEKIDSLDSSAINESNVEEKETEVAEARVGYDALTEDQKALVDSATLQKLTGAEAAVKEIKDEKAAASVQAAVQALPSKTELALTDEARVNAAAAKYDALTDDQKARLPSSVKTTIDELKSKITELKSSGGGSGSGGNEGGGQSGTATYNIADAEVTGVANKNYTGKAIKQNPVVVLNCKTLASGSDYSIAYKNNVRIGVAAVTITGKGIYTGSKSLTFQIGPKAASIKKPASAKKAINAKWKKLTTKMVLSNGKKARITGYQVQYSMSSKFASGNKTVTVKGYNKTSKKIKVKAKKKYYVRVRTFLKYGGKTYYSTWSKAKAVKSK